MAAHQGDHQCYATAQGCEKARLERPLLVSSRMIEKMYRTMHTPGADWGVVLVRMYPTMSVSRIPKVVADARVVAPVLDESPVGTFTHCARPSQPLSPTSSTRKPRRFWSYLCGPSTRLGKLYMYTPNAA